MSGSMIVARVIKKNNSLNLQFKTLKAYAAKEEAMSTPEILKTARYKVLNKHLEKLIFEIAS
jgi:hypothetical protein